jgi:hypothetical protein
MALAESPPRRPIGAARAISAEPAAPVGSAWPPAGSVRSAAQDGRPSGLSLPLAQSPPIARPAASSSLLTTGSTS